MWRARWDTGGTHTFETERPATDAPKSKELDGGGRDTATPLSRERKLTPRGRWETHVLKLAESLRSRLATPHETQSTYGRPANPWNTGQNQEQIRPDDSRG